MSDIEIKLTANLDDATRGVSGFRKEYAELVRAVEKPLRQVDSFRALESSLESTERQMRAARESVRTLGDQMAATASPTKKLQLEYRDAVTQLRLLERQEGSQSLQLGKMRRELQAAGLDTRNLAAEQRKLQGELGKRLNVGQRDASIQTAKTDLGIAKFTNTTAEISKLQQQFQLLRSTGKLTATEIAIAQNTLRQSLAAAAAQTATLTGATTTWRAGLSDVRGELLAGAAAFGGFAVMAKNSFGQFAGIEQQVAAIGTITDLSDQQLSALSGSIRALSLDMGKSARESASAVYDLLGSGVATADAMKVLELSTKAAVAGMADTKTAAGVGVSIINAYGESMSNLGMRYDQLFIAIQDGVVSFDQLAAGLGQVLPTAAAAGVGFDEVGAAIASMTVQGIQAPIAITALRSAINQLAAPADQAKKAMKSLGIEWNGLSGTLEQIARKNIGFEALRQIVPDTEGRTAVLALTKDYAGFLALVEKMEAAGGATERAYQKMSNTPDAQVDKFKAAMQALSDEFGKAVAQGLPIVNLITDMLKAFSSLPGPVKTALISVIAMGVAGKALSTVVRLLSLGFKGFAGGLSTVAATAGTAGAAVGGLAGGVGRLTSVLGGLKGAIGGGIVIWSASQLADLYAVYSEMQELKKAQADQAAALDGVIAKNAEYKDTLVAASSEIVRMTDAERKAYVQRLQNAQTYYSKLAEQISRADGEKYGHTAPVTEEALAAFRKAREYGRALEEESRLEADRLADTKQFSSAIAADQKTALGALKASLKQRVNAEKAAAAEIKKVKAAQLDTEKRYAQAISDLKAGPEKKASYGGAQQLKVDARKALGAGNVDEAKQKAQAALAMLQKLAEAGENTYGFEGFINQLKSIEQAADKLSLERAEAKQAAAAEQVSQLKADIAQLENVKITPEMSQEALAEADRVISEMAQKWGQLLVIPLRVQPTSEMQAIAGQVASPNVQFPVKPSTPVVPVSPVPTTPAKISTEPPKAQLKHIPGVTDYSQQSVRVGVDPEVDAAAMERLKEDIMKAAGLTVPVTPKLERGALQDIDVPVKTEIDQASAAAVQSQAAEIAEKLKRTLVIPVGMQGNTQVVDKGSNSWAQPGFARGDMVRGPGTGTSDSIVARLSNGEFVMRAAAVRHYGPELLRQINEQRFNFPAFAAGGEVGPRFVPSVPAPSQSLLDKSNPAPAEPFGSLALTIGDKTYNVQAPGQEFERMVRDQRIKWGRTR